MSMVTFEGVDYHAIPVPINSCHPKGFPPCHFADSTDCENTPQGYLCCPITTCSPSLIFLTRTEYIQHVAKRLTT